MSPCDRPTLQPRFPFAPAVAGRSATSRLRLTAALALVLAGSLPAPPSSAAPRPGSKIEIGAPEPVDPARMARMRTWHARYKRAVVPLRRALAAVIDHPGDTGDPGMLAACLELEDRMLEIDRRTLLPAPDFAVSRHVTRALSELRDAASACLSGADRTMAYRLEKSREAMADAALALRPYRLEP